MTSAKNLIGRFYYSPHLLSVLQLQLDLRHLCDPSPQEAPVGLGTLVAPEDPVDPMDQELPAEHEHRQKTEQNVQRNQKKAKTKNPVKVGQTEPSGWDS